MTPTADHPVAAYRTIGAGHRDVRAKNHQYFRSPYTRSCDGRGGNESCNQIDVFSGAGNGNLTVAVTRSLDDSRLPARRSTDFIDCNRSASCHLPSIDVTADSRRRKPSMASQSKLTPAADNPHIATAGYPASPQLPPRKQLRTSRDQDEFGGYSQGRHSQRRHQQASEKSRRVSLPTFSKQQQQQVRHAVEVLSDQAAGSESDSGYYSGVGTSASPPTIVISPADSPSLVVIPPKSILAWYRCHDCSQENVRTFVDGLEMIQPSTRRHRRPIACLQPSATATAVLAGLSLSPRPSTSGVDADDLLGNDVSVPNGRRSTGMTGCRKSVRFEPTVRVFCDDDVPPLVINQLLPASENSAGEETNGDRLPPLHRTRSQSPPPQQCLTTSGLNGDDIPAVVQRYMVRCCRQQEIQHGPVGAGSSLLTRRKPFTVEADATIDDVIDDDEEYQTISRRVLINRQPVKHWKP